MATARELFEQGSKAFNDHDMDALLAVYADDAEFKGPGGMTARGHDEIRQQYADARVSQIYDGTRKVMKSTVE